MNNSPVRVITGEARLSYVHLFKPYSNDPNKEPKYSVTVLIPKSDIATKQRIDAAIQAAIQEGASSKWNGVRPPMVPTPIHDGDGVRPSGEPFAPECKGHWVFTASSKQQPQVVDLQVQPILNQTDVYSGMYARVSIMFFPYSANGKKGIGCGLGNVQKLRDGEPLGGRTNAADDFGAAPVQQYQQPAPAYQPQPQYQQPAPQPNYGYGTAPAQTPGYGTAPQQPQQQYQQPQQQYDPITGAPIGGVMGI